MSNNQKLPLSLTLIAAVVPALLAMAARADVEIKIGQVGPLTGPVAHMGQDLENGARLAIEDLNAKKLKIGGQAVKWVLVSEDDAGDPKTATVVAQKLADNKVNGVVGHYNTGTTIPASKIYAAAGIPQIVPSATGPKITQQGYKGLFRVLANDIKMGSALGNYAVKKLGGKTVAIIDDRTAYGQGLADQMEKAVKAAGGNVVAREFGTDKTTDWMAVLTSIKSRNPDVLMYGGLDASAAPLLQQMRHLGMKAKFMTGSGACTPELIRLSGDGMNSDAYCVKAGMPGDRMPKGASFYKRYKDKFGVEVQVYAPYAYDAVIALATAMQNANSADPAQYLPKLSALKLSGVTADIEFDGNGDLEKAPITVLRFTDGSWKPLEVVQ